MARKPSPWYREGRDEWCVTYKGQHIRLGPHPKGASRPKKSEKTGRWNAPADIEKAFAAIVNAPAEVNLPADDDVVTVLDAFITWCRENRAERTTVRYAEICQDFVKTAVNGVKIGAMPCNRLSAREVTRWLEARPSWGPTTKRNAITALQRGFNWAVKTHGLPRNPIKGMEKPAAKRRTDVVSPVEFETLLAAVKDQPFRDVLVMSYDTGLRPQELKILESRHAQLDKRRLVIPGEEAKGGIARAIYLPTERSLEVVKRLCERNRDGLLFRNRLGNRWTGFAVKCRMEDLDHVLGRRVTHYALRHSFVTRNLIAGVDSHVVAALAGHKDTKMLDEVYSHVADDHEFMLRMAQKAVGG